MKPTSDGKGCCEKPIDNGYLRCANCWTSWYGATQEKTPSKGECCLAKIPISATKIADILLLCPKHGKELNTWFIGTRDMLKKMI